MHRIVITGAESSGKTTLAQELAAALHAPWVEEYARAYLEGTGGRYEEKDLRAIAEGQLRAEDERAANSTASFLVCDTDLITLRLWSEDKYGRCDPWIVRRTEERPYALWLLCRPDIPWEPDPLRENPHDRDRLFDLYERTLRELRKPYAVIGGDRVERVERALAAVRRHLG